MNRLFPFAALVLMLALALLRETAPSLALTQGIGCEMFSSQEDAQAVFEANPDDRADMDPDGNGIACEEKATRSGEKASTTGRPMPTPTPTPAPTPTPVPTTDAIPDERHADIDWFWRRTFEDAGLVYQPVAGVVALEDWSGYWGACGAAPVAERGDVLAFYCPGDFLVAFDPDARAELEDQRGEWAWVMVIAHEWSHHALFLLGLNTGGQEEELLANCLAGSYLRDAEERLWMDTEEVDEAFKFGGSTRKEAAGREREPGENSFYDGYDGGLDACGVDL